jgi:hypothetical protein
VVYVDRNLRGICAGRKKPEEELVSMNLGLGASLVLLLSKSAVELNKMVELRSQMEALVSGIRQDAIGKEKAAGAPAPASSQAESNASTTTVISDPIARAAAAEDALSDSCSGARTADRRAVIAMDQNQMEAELQVELSRLQTQQKRVAQPMHGLEVRSGVPHGISLSRCVARTPCMHACTSETRAFVC